MKIPKAFWLIMQRNKMIEKVMHAALKESRTMSGKISFRSVANDNNSDTGCTIAKMQADMVRLLVMNIRIKYSSMSGKKDGAGARCQPERLNPSIKISL
jgi:hypothetical protein